MKRLKEFEAAMTDYVSGRLLIGMAGWSVDVVGRDGVAGRSSENIPETALPHPSHTTPPQFLQHSERAGLGLQLLPGVERLLETLKVG
jgi:hypothetical protein